MVAGAVLAALAALAAVPAAARSALVRALVDHPPPVCAAVFIAAGMIGENWLGVATTAMALALGLYPIPIGMVANPAVLGLAAAPGAADLAAARSVPASL